MMSRVHASEALRTLLHNLVAHPLAGLCWAVGWDELGERIHSLWVHDPSRPE